MSTVSAAKQTNLNKNKCKNATATTTNKKENKLRNRKSDDFEDVEIEDDYDDCKDIVDELKNSNSLIKHKIGQQQPPPPQSPMKQLNLNEPIKRNNENSIVDESPKKRSKMPNECENSSKLQQQGLIKPSSLALASLKNRLSPRKNQQQRSSSMCEPTETSKKSFASTPKSERKVQSRVKQLVDSAAYERNLSNSWADIIEEIEEQSKELNEYIEKVVAKYKLDKEVLMKNLECDTEVLRKRQKRINFGKITNEYQRYINELAKRDRKPYHPRTPNKYRKCSRRKFDGLIKKWRKMLHVWDENPDELINFKHSLDTNEDGDDYTDDFGGTSNITGSNFSYIVDDYDIIDDDESAADNNQK